MTDNQYVFENCTTTTLLPQLSKGNGNCGNDDGNGYNEDVDDHYSPDGMMVSPMMCYLLQYAIT